uniref:Poly(A) polymerase n=1 Tax=Opuntia streptacantha TaxID=393608 RepID=A0A7C9AMD2_OPUST
MDFHSHLSLSLLQFMSDQGLIPSPEEDLKREIIINKLKATVLKWIKRVAWQRRLPVDVISAASATILPYGSYGLGVHDSESDTDALCVGPCFASRAEDFFVVLCNMLKNMPGVLDVHSVKDAKVPLMRFKFEGISVDLLYAQLQFTSVPENVDLLDPASLTGIDDNTRKSLSGVRANQSILQLVPNLQSFQSLLRCIKFWAKQRGVYGSLFGYLGGIHLAILAAFICLKNPDAGLSVLVRSFFDTFANWPWPTPAALQDEVMTFKEDANEKMSWMPIRLPCSPYEFCQSNITRGTFNRIRTEFLRGHSITRDLLRPDFDWGSLFEPFDYRKRYSWFLKIYLSAWEKDDLGDWIGWVKSRFPRLILKLEEVKRSCDPNPTEYVEIGSSEAESSVVFCWGLHPSRAQFDVALVEEDFRNHLNGGPTGTIRLAVVQASEFPSTTQSTTGKVKATKACWGTPDCDQRTTPAFSVLTASS